MNTKALLIPVIAILAIFLVGFVAAGDLADDISVKFNDIKLDNTDAMTATVGETVPVRVTFTAEDTMSDVRVKVWIEGSRDDVETRTGRFNILEGKVYTKLLSLEMPADMEETSEEYTIHVSISSGNGYDSEEYVISLQRESYNFEVLSVDHNSEVSAGETFPVAIVVENVGMEELENGYVVVSIPELGISTRGYFGDLIPTDDDCDDDCDKVDALQKTVYLKVPANADTGVYEMTVKVYNRDSTATVKRLISVEETQSTTVIPATTSLDMKAGETKAFDLIVVNSGDDIQIYTISTVAGSSVLVSAPAVITVGPDASQTVRVEVTAPSDLSKGAYTFTVNVGSEQVVLGVNVTGSSVSTSVVALTVVLAIIFIVLLVILVVLLVKKDNKVSAEEVETSYY